MPSRRTSRSLHGFIPNTKDFQGFRPAATPSRALAWEVHGVETVVQLQLQIASGPGQTRQTIQALRSLMVPAQLDCGCSGCWLYVDALAPRSLCYVEEWAAPADLEHEIRAPRFTRLLSVMEGAPVRPSLEFRFISQTRGLDYIEAVRVLDHNGRIIRPV